MNRSLVQTTMPKRDQATQSFEEINLGYSEQEAFLEADRCLNCRHQPCVSGCPIHVPIPQFIAKIKENKIQEAYDIILTQSNFPELCSRVCHVEQQCEKNCVRGIKGESVAINHLERYVADQCCHQAIQVRKSHPKKVAIIGSGPSGLACASDCRQYGYDVTVFEKEAYAGGIISYGVPNYRLPNHWVQQEVDKLKAAGVRFCFNTPLSSFEQLEQMKQEYDALYLAFGEEMMTTISLENNHLPQVYSSYDYLKEIFETQGQSLQYQKVVVIGGGNTAMDCARSARRLGSEVTLSYRRTQEDMPATHEEIRGALEEGVQFDLLSSPVKIVGNEKVEGIILECREVIPQETGRNETKVIEGSEYRVDCDCVVLALGSKPNPFFRQLLQLDLDEKGKIIVDENQQTSEEGIYAGGDNTLGADTVVRAVGCGKKAAAQIIKQLQGVSER